MSPISAYIFFSHPTHCNRNDGLFGTKLFFPIRNDQRGFFWFLYQNPYVQVAVIKNYNLSSVECHEGGGKMRGRRNRVEKKESYLSGSGNGYLCERLLLAYPEGEGIMISV